jgi:hypothetical protein
MQNIIIAIIGFAGVMGASVFTARATAVGSIDGKLENRTEEIRMVDKEQGESIAALKEAVSTIKSDNADIKKDIKEILKAVK